MILEVYFGGTLKQRITKYTVTGGINKSFWSLRQGLQTSHTGIAVYLMDVSSLKKIAEWVQAGINY